MARPAVTPVVIETREAYLSAVASIAAGEGPVAVDAERASGFRFSQRAYLIQVFRRGAGTFLFDPPAIGSFDELQQTIGDLEWVLHAASQDLPCLRELSLEPGSLFDTELGARLAGMPRVGLGTVVEETLGLHLAKEHSAADWSTRPLPASWLVYAALDVELLLDVRDAIAAKLDSSGKAELARQEFVAVLDRVAPEPRAEPWRRLSGLHTVRGQRALAVARELWVARDAYAREVDTSPGRLLPDSSIIIAARATLASKRELAAMKSFNGRASRSQLDRWWAAIEAGLATDDLPAFRSGEE
ncbi:MAG: HRDC domain-containing protein, partial [Microcella sp.]|nr:HRDC domain-containing protein [Microcella sp.]